jgi:hypothetical protein
VGCTPKPFATTASLGVVTTTGETDCWRFPARAGGLRQTVICTIG